MTMFSEGWNDNADRFDSHIIHYAGEGIFDKGIIVNKTEQIISDMRVIEIFEKEIQMESVE